MLTTNQDPWIAYQLDHAVNFLGLTVENAAQEMHKVGIGKDTSYEPVYRMDQLLDPEFRLPRPPTEKERQRAAIDSLKAFAGKSNAVKVFKAGG